MRIATYNIWNNDTSWQERIEAICEEDVEESNFCATRVTSTLGGQEWGITNVHLNWRSSSIRECQMEVVRDWLSKGPQKAIEVLCGDFNDHPQSTIYYGLSDAGWLDVTTFVAEEPRATLDVKHNPYLQSSLISSNLNDMIGFWYVRNIVDSRFSMSMYLET